MHDLRSIRANPGAARAGLAKKKAAVDLDRLLETDASRRALLASVEALKAEKNVASERIGHQKKAGLDVAEEIARLQEANVRIRHLEEEVKAVEEELTRQLMFLPNLPHESVPAGSDERDNVEVRRWGTPRDFGFPPQPHWDLGPALGILDFERAVKVAGARFAINRGAGALLERALGNFMLDLHTREHGYTEILPPFMVNPDCMVGTGQLPKFEDDMFRVANNGFFLIPTAEVPLTNLHRDEILTEADLPIAYVAYTPCFRAEAGSAGRDTRGLIRVHQFSKVELVRFSAPETSYEELELLTGHAEEVLRRLGLPYRKTLLASGDLSFSSAKTYDLEVWLPSYGGFKEISSCSNFEAFQARRAGIRFRRAGGKVEFAHTLNGSGVAVGRALAAIIEHCQERDGTVIVPAALRPYMNGMERITRDSG
jgi:seryl-tRNA synthetase